MPPSVQCARARPTAAATIDSNRLSATSCRTSRKRPAPSAARMANSRLRSMPRARRRLPTFAHPIPSTSTTAPSISMSGRLDAAHQVLAQRDDDGAAGRIGSRILAREHGRDRVHLALRLLDGDARRQTRHNVPPAAGADTLLMVLHDLRRPHGELAGSRQELRRERLGQHADNRPRLTVHADRSVDDVRVAGVAGLPEAIADDNGAPCAADVLFWQKPAADEWRHPDGVEKPVGDLRAEQCFGLGPAGIAHRVGNHASHHRERSRSIAPIEKVGGRNVLVLCRARGLTLPDGDDAVGILIGQGPELQRVEKRDDRHGPANAQRQNQNGRRGEGRRFDEHADAVFHVVHDIGICGELSCAARRRRAARRAHGGTNPCELSNHDVHRCRGSASGDGLRPPTRRATRPATGRARRSRTRARAPGTARERADRARLPSSGARRLEPAG